MAVLISETTHNTMPNVCPTKELVKLIASTYKLRFVNQLANMQKSTFTLGQYVRGLSKFSVTHRELGSSLKKKYTYIINNKNITYLKKKKKKKKTPFFFREVKEELPNYQTARADKNKN